MEFGDRCPVPEQNLILHRQDCPFIKMTEVYYFNLRPYLGATEGCVLYSTCREMSTLVSLSPLSPYSQKTTVS